MPPSNLATPIVPWKKSVAVPAPLCLYAMTVPPDWIDYHGHMSEAFYLMALSEAIDPFFDYIGCNAAYRAGGRSLYSVSWRLDFQAEGRAGDSLTVETLMVASDLKRLHLVHHLRRGDQTIAIGEQILLHVDMIAGRSVIMDETLLSPLAAVKAAHAALPRPPTMGQGIGLSTRDQKS
jgi:acyl-CoA thioester hydrolase